MDLLFWQTSTIFAQNETAIFDNIDLGEFAKNYEDKSLFHHFYESS